jgi:NAD(P)H-nitrite reductase large subunit
VSVWRRSILKSSAMANKKFICSVTCVYQPTIMSGIASLTSVRAIDGCSVSHWRVS